MNPLLPTLLALPLCPAAGGHLGEGKPSQCHGLQSVGAGACDEGTQMRLAAVLPSWVSGFHDWDTEQAGGSIAGGSSTPLCSRLKEASVDETM